MVKRQLRKQTRRRKQRGGASAAYSWGAPIIPGVDAGLEVVAGEGCRAAPRFGEITPPTPTGLPGNWGGGGKRKSRRSRRSMKKQRGGRYTLDLTPLNPAAPWAGGIAGAVRIPCEGSTPNPLNPGPHTPSTQPPIQQQGGVGGVDSAFYSAPTAGYSNTPSTWVGSTGSPSLLQTPYEARTLNPACLKTAGGGGRRRKTVGKRKRTGRK